MKTIVCVVLGLIFLQSGAQAQMFQTVASEDAQLLQSGPGKLYCPNCGMNLVKFYKTSHAAELDDGTIHQYCSLHCLVETHEQIDTTMRVVDALDLKFIPASTAFYVVGSSKPGTMTKNSKYAFASKSAAKTFATDNGGDIVDFVAAVEIARKGLAAENKMIAGKRAKMAEKGRTIFNRLYGETDLPTFSSIAEAKTYIVDHGLFGTLNDTQHQAVAIYLVSQQAFEDQTAKKIEVPDGTKCPVCGMFVAKYPKWAAMLRTQDGQALYFDGVKDMMKLYFQPKAYKVNLTPTTLAGIFVTDYYTLTQVDATQAWYVVGSNVYGPMGNELIPFRSRQDAQVFKDDHFGQRVLSFKDITETLVHDLDK